MRKRLFGSIVFLCFATLVAGGCAKKDMVKPEEKAPSVQAVPSVPAEPEPSYVPKMQPEPSKAEPMTETPTREAVVQQEKAKDSNGAASLESELQKIYFNFDSAALSDEARNTLSRYAEQLAKQPSVKVRIEGNCDERGSDDYNMALGERRAKAAKDYLANLGVAPERLSTISYGEEKPAVAGHDEAAWAKNRRDEFVIVK